MLRTKYSEEIEKQMKAYFDTLNEKDIRGYAAIEAMKLGHGGQNYISTVLHQLDQKIIYPHYDFKHLTEKYFEIGMKLRNG